MDWVARSRAQRFLSSLVLHGADFLVSVPAELLVQVVQDLVRGIQVMLSIPDFLSDVLWKDVEQHPVQMYFRDVETVGLPQS